MGKNKKQTNESRRDFLKQMGIAASVAVPFMKSEVAMGQTTTAPTRVLFIPLAHGWGINPYDAKMTANADGSIGSFPAPMAAFNAIKDQCVVVEGLRSSYWGNAHDVSYSDIFTCAVSPDAPANNALGGPFMYPKSASLDWMIGNQVGKEVLRLSHNYSSWGAPYHPLSFDSSLRNLPYFKTPRDAYMSVIDPLKKAQTPTTNIDNTVNDALLKMLGANGSSYLTRLSGAPKAKVDSYISALNALGNRILTPQAPSNNNVPLPELPGMTQAFADGFDSYLEIIRVAFTLDTHRVAVLGLGEGVSNWSWTNTSGQAQVGNTFGNDFHHQVAHYDKLANPMAAMAGWTNWYAGKIAAFVQKLKTITDVDGRPLIDNTIIVLTGEVGNGNHDRYTMGHTVIGGGGQGRIRRNRVIKLPTFDSRNRGDIVWGSRNLNGSLHICDVTYLTVSRHHMSDLWVSVARLAGLNINTFGFDVYNYAPIQLT
ncbi:DUF1552 domain-containing protein [Bdellovibrio sp. HCB337]|uniref:DUF1552 domain-containing protein n=1 Tax=Bdellovibrio sp. HCB337 TaxID=3394358 RepID=UPI0039A5DB63